MFVQIKNIWSRLVQISLVRLTNTRIHSGDQRDNYNLPFGQLHLACGKIHFVQMAKCIWSRFPWSVWAIPGQTVGQKRQEGGRTAQLRPMEGIDIRMRIFCLLMMKVRQQQWQFTDQKAPSWIKFTQMSQIWRKCRAKSKQKFPASNGSQSEATKTAKQLNSNTDY